MSAGPSGTATQPLDSQSESESEKSQSDDLDDILEETKTNVTSSNTWWNRRFTEGDLVRNPNTSMADWKLMVERETPPLLEYFQHEPNDFQDLCSDYYWYLAQVEKISALEKAKKALKKTARDKPKAKLQNLKTKAPTLTKWDPKNVQSRTPEEHVHEADDICTRYMGADMKKTEDRRICLAQIRESLVGKNSLRSFDQDWQDWTNADPDRKHKVPSLKVVTTWLHNMVTQHVSTKDLLLQLARIKQKSNTLSAYNAYVLSFKAAKTRLNASPKAKVNLFSMKTYFHEGLHSTYLGKPEIKKFGQDEFIADDDLDFDSFVQSISDQAELEFQDAHPPDKKRIRWMKTDPDELVAALDAATGVNKKHKGGRKGGKSGGKNKPGQKGRKGGKGTNHPPSSHFTEKDLCKTCGLLHNQRNFTGCWMDPSTKDVPASVRRLEGKELEEYRKANVKKFLDRRAATK